MKKAKNWVNLRVPEHTHQLWKLLAERAGTSISGLLESVALALANQIENDPTEEEGEPE